jgi:hypothetical protein
MKNLLLLTLILSTTVAYGAKLKNRKVSNSRYFICSLERDSSDKKFFKKEYHFPFPTDEGEVYELKGSMRWNEFKIVFTQSGKVDIKISETIEGEKVTSELKHDMGKEAHFKSFNVQVNLKKDEVAIPYLISCSPE